MKDFEKMSLDELKDYAKSIGMTVGNIGKDKLIEKIKDKEEKDKTIENVLNDDDIDEKNDVDESPKDDVDKNVSLLDSISDAIDELEDAAGGEIEEFEELPTEAKIPVKSITFGGLTYISRTTNATFRWNQIGAIQYMTIGQLNEMNNYNSDFLRDPLVILMNETAIKQFRLTSVYEDVAKINNLTDLFKCDLATIEKTIDEALEVNMRNILISKIQQMYKNHKLTDINVIRLLERKLKFDLTE